MSKNNKGKQKKVAFKADPINLVRDIALLPSDSAIIELINKLSLKELNKVDTTLIEHPSGTPVCFTLPPLIMATIWNRPLIVFELLKKGVDVNIVGSKGTALVAVLEQKNWLIAGILIAFEAKIDAFAAKQDEVKSFLQIKEIAQTIINCISKKETMVVSEEEVVKFREQENIVSLEARLRYLKLKEKHKLSDNMIKIIAENFQEIAGVHFQFKEKLGVDLSCFYPKDNCKKDEVKADNSNINNNNYHSEKKQEILPEEPEKVEIIGETTVCTDIWVPD